MGCLPIQPLGPPLGAMKNTNDFDCLVANPVRYDKRCASNHQFSGALDATKASHIRVERQPRNRTMNAVKNFCGRSWVLSCDVFADLIEISYGCPKPSDLEPTWQMPPPPLLEMQNPPRQLPLILDVFRRSAKIASPHTPRWPGSLGVWLGARLPAPAGPTAPWCVGKDAVSSLLMSSRLVSE